MFDHFNFFPEQIFMYVSGLAANVLQSRRNVGREHFRSIKGLYLTPSPVSGPGLVNREELPRERAEK